MLFETSTYIYENKCPVCGKKYVALNEHNYTCEDCKSVYSLLTVDDKEMLWIKSFRRK
jgi:Zn finger protein HypA/HybF involved in hydrogenase expression